MEKLEVNTNHIELLEVQCQEKILYKTDFLIARSEIEYSNKVQK